MEALRFCSSQKMKDYWLLQIGIKMLTYNYQNCFFLLDYVQILSLDKPGFLDQKYYMSFLWCWTWVQIHLIFTYPTSKLANHTFLMWSSNIKGDTSSYWLLKYCAAIWRVCVCKERIFEVRSMKWCHYMSIPILKMRTTTNDWAIPFLYKIHMANYIQRRWQAIPYTNSVNW